MYLLCILFFLTYFADKNLAMSLKIYKYLLQHVKLTNMCDCSVMIFHSMVTVLLEHLDFPISMC